VVEVVGHVGGAVVAARPGVRLVGDLDRLPLGAGVGEVGVEEVRPDVVDGLVPGP
jgi:hypothetical protein